MEKEFLELSKVNYNGKFEGSMESEFIESAHNFGGYNLLTKIYENLQKWELKENFVKYFLRDDKKIQDSTLLERFQQEYYQYLVEKGYIVDFCAYHNANG